MKLKYVYYIILSILILIFFTKDLKINNEKIILVNKTKKLNSNYVPLNLVKISEKYTQGDKYLDEEALKSFEKLIKDATDENYKITITSAYRDYDYQKNLFEYYVKNKGIEYALMASAKPGYSEHQTGLAIDVEGDNNDYNNFDKTKEYKWMLENAYKYGFILRYPKDKENITGFKFEPWHYRYVGKKAAKYIYENNLTLEEYLKR